MVIQPKKASYSSVVAKSLMAAAPIAEPFKVKVKTLGLEDTLPPDSPPQKSIQADIGARDGSRPWSNSSHRDWSKSALRSSSNHQTLSVTPATTDHWKRSNRRSQGGTLLIPNIHCHPKLSKLLLGSGEWPRKEITGPRQFNLIWAGIKNPKMG